MTKDGDAIDRIREQIEEIKKHIADVRAQIGDWDRERFNAIAEVSQATAVTVGVIQERQKADGQSLLRTESMVEEIRDAMRELTGSVHVLDKDVAVMRATTPKTEPQISSIPSHQRSVAIAAVVALAAAMWGGPKWFAEFVAEMFKGKP